MDDVTKAGGYGQQKEDAIGRTVWRTGFGTDYGPVVRQTIERMNRCTGLSRDYNLHILYWTSPQSVTENF
jgi:hypothetical protein